MWARNIQSTNQNCYRLSQHTEYILLLRYQWWTEKTHLNMNFQLSPISWYDDTAENSPKPGLCLGFFLFPPQYAFNTFPLLSVSPCCLLYPFRIKLKIINISMCRSDSRHGFGLESGFINHFNTRLISTLNYSAIADLHTL